MIEPTPGLARSHRELDAARLLSGEGYAAQAVSRAYFAAFYAAEAALLELGETRSKHAGVIAAFTQKLVKAGEIDEQVGRLLRSLFERRAQADYSVDEIPEEEARRAVDDAERCVARVAEWLDRRHRGVSGSAGD